VTHIEANKDELCGLQVGQIKGPFSKKNFIGRKTFFLPYPPDEDCICPLVVLMRKANRQTIIALNILINKRQFNRKTMFINHFFSNKNFNLN